jgi:hypothetical protein
LYDAPSMRRRELVAACLSIAAGSIAAGASPPAEAAPKAAARSPARRASPHGRPPLATRAVVSPAPAPAAAPAQAPPPAVAEPAPSPPPPAPAPPALRPRDRAEPPPSSEPRRRFTISLNPLPLVAGRYGLNVEMVPFRHHAVVASGWIQTFTPTMLDVVMPREIDTSKGADTLPGGEIGWRVYSGDDGAHGLFAGISGVAMPLAYPRVGDDFRSSVASFHGYGAAFDVGVQAMTGSGFTIGGGVGVMYLAYAVPPSVTPPPGVSVPDLPQPHVLPRLLLAAGWSF